MLINSLLALESTVIAHGLPYPQNLETARELENVARACGVSPRTIAIIAGEIKVGLTDTELEHLARACDVLKLSRRDIAIAIAQKRDGATTVSATMFLAHRAGIRVFATGGIGGVHRAVGNRQTWDVSTDLPELAQTPVVVVCAGAKAILDLPATLEWLETHGVPVIGFQTDEFPAFYSRSSGLRLSTRVDSAREAARIVKTHWDLGFTSGVLVGVPIPREYETPREVIEPFLERALREAEEQKIIGNAVSPFLLKRIAELTGGESVKTNVALLRNNVAVAAEIAKELKRLEAPEE
jgi:pseudouridylate synthase